MSRILVTGSKGFFGTRFIAMFGSHHTIQGIDKDEVDITDREAVTSAIQAFRPDLVIHAAAITATDFSNEHPELTQKINVGGAVHVAEAAQSVEARMIFFSTEQVFNGNVEPGPYDEQTIPNPDTMYGITKYRAEGILPTIIDRLWILRFTWLFGLPERNMPVNPNILWNALQIAVDGKPVKIPTNEFRGHSYGYDMISAVMKVPEIPYGTYHIGSRNDAGRYDTTAHILSELGLADRLPGLIIPDSERYPQRRELRMTTDKIAACGITFEPSIDALSRAIGEFGLKNAF